MKEDDEMAFMTLNQIDVSYDKEADFKRAGPEGGRASWCPFWGPAAAGSPPPSGWSPVLSIPRAVPFSLDGDDMTKGGCAQAEFWPGIPELCPVSPSERVRQCGLRPAYQENGQRT